MKSFLYFLFGFGVFVEISMTMRALHGLEQFTLPYLTAMVIIGGVSYYCLTKGISVPTHVEKGIPLKSAPIETREIKIIKTVPTRENEYLLLADLDKTIIKEDYENSLIIYNSWLKEVNISEEFKEIVRYFFIPYNISVIKFGFNKEYSQLQDTIKEVEKNNKLVSPSLRKMGGDRKYRAMGYPEFFYTVFPDVVIWGMMDGYQEVKKELSFYVNEINDSTETHLSFPILKLIIGLYLKSTGKILECQTINLKND